MNPLCLKRSKWAWSWNVYPRLGGVAFWRVLLFHKKTDFHDYVRKCQRLVGSNRLSGLVGSTARIINTMPSLGTISMSAEDVTLGTVVHECYHAMRYSMVIKGRGAKYQNLPLAVDERMAYMIERLVIQFYRGYLRIPRVHRVAIV